MGTFDNHAINYTDINYENIEHSIKVVKEIVGRYHDHPAVLGLEPVNEPWELTPLNLLKQFYWDAYLIVKKQAPYWKFIMHDSFRFTPETWGGFMKGCPDRALDTHIYQAWMDPAPRTTFYRSACAQKSQIALMEREFGPVVVGEWSLATDNCAMWLNGFNDNLPGFPRSPCKYVPCSPPYMGSEQPGTPLDLRRGLQVSLDASTYGWITYLFQSKICHAKT
jgi:glucan 1,3-beta-glucosidase